MPVKHFYLAMDWEVYWGGWELSIKPGGWGENAENAAFCSQDPAAHQCPWQRCPPTQADLEVNKVPLICLFIPKQEGLLGTQANELWGNHSPAVTSETKHQPSSLPEYFAEGLAVTSPQELCAAF